MKYANKKDVLIVLAAIQMILDNFEGLEKSVLYKKQIKYFGNRLLQEVKALEVNLSDGKDPNAMSQWVDISMITENVIRDILDVPAQNIEQLDKELETLINKYKI